MSKEEKLLELARAEFGELSPADIKLFTAIAKGEVADYSSDNEAENNPANAENWGEERRLKADRIEWLCTDREALECITRKGIWIKGARIEGELDLSFIKITFPLSFQKCSISHRISLHDAQISLLNLAGTHTGPIIADRLKLTGSIFLRYDFKSDSELRFNNAIIEDNFDCESGKFINPYGISLNLQGIKIYGSLNLCNGFEAEGEVKLSFADIKRNLNCSNGIFQKTSHPTNEKLNTLNSYAISADRLIVGNNIFLEDGFKANGKVLFTGCTVSGYLGYFDIKDISLMSMDLSFTHVGVLFDKDNSWPDKGNLLLDGFTYDNIYEKAPLEPEKRIEWLRRQPENEYHPQPYEQLAKFYQKSGYDEYAKQVLIAKNEDEAYLRQLNKRQKAWHKILKYTLGYGYRPWRALYWGLAIMAIGVIMFCKGAENKTILPTNNWAYKDSTVADSVIQVLNEAYPHFCPAAYSIDMFVPFVNLHQEEYWLPVATAAKLGVNLRLYMWFHIFAGWFLSTLLAVGLSGLIKK